MGRRVGYFCAYVVDQIEINQKELKERLGVDCIFIDLLVGVDSDQTNFKEMVGQLKEGDTLVVDSILRLTTSVSDLFDIVAQLNRRGVNFISQEENIDTTKPEGKVIFTFFTIIQQLEKQREERKKAELLVKYKKPRTVDVNQDGFKEVYGEWKDGGITATKAWEKLGVSKSTFYRLVKDYEKELSDCK